jgi:hypothetical protein
LYLNTLVFMQNNMTKAQNVTALLFLLHHWQHIWFHIKEYVVTQNETFKLGDITNFSNESQDTVQSGKIVFTIPQTKNSHDSEIW